MPQDRAVLAAQHGKKRRRAKLPPGVKEAQWKIYKQAARFFLQVDCYGTDMKGSAFVITEHGYAVTCEHVIRGATKIRVTRFRLDRATFRLRPLKRKFTAKVVLADPAIDVAFLKIVRPPRGLRAADLGDSDCLENGIGLYRLGRDDTVLSSGYVYDFTDHHGYPQVEVGLVADSGASGGPLFDDNGGVFAMIQYAPTAADQSPPFVLGVTMKVIRDRMAKEPELAELLPDDDEQEAETTTAPEKEGQPPSV
ncbi:MAG: serine protease [Patescibacteria group bacterium]|nr:serine protease [Patescibacteria group bacterium]